MELSFKEAEFSPKERIHPFLLKRPSNRLCSLSSLRACSEDGSRFASSVEHAIKDNNMSKLKIFIDYFSNIKLLGYLFKKLNLPEMRLQRKIRTLLTFELTPNGQLPRSSL